MDGNKADFYHNRAFAYRKIKKFELAVKDYSSAIEIDPTHFKAFYNRAFCYDKLGDNDKALFDYKMALQL